ncbi:HU family DNA-binding protein [Gordonia sp. HY002]|uniref:HU family DNA-binding protein n=1 Tax=Gordonia zhenghanii TaxID=2911516 RepID=UPI001EF12D79|nr:HU family DNA-binding protein [Gordonia zhenghanii]MCF8571357.1 HU family DNA-binding protein [Gordonia zhenghanii]MCF8604869.1 HU family DNA-binding protein [Gordonia zhenghanii]
MNKAELVEELAKSLDADRKTANTAVEHLIDTIVRAVNKGESVTITGFGVFEKRARAARVARNPRTGETVKVAATQVPSFRPGAQFKAIVAGQQKLSAGQPAVKRAAPDAVPPTKTAAKKTAAKKTAAKKTAAKKAPAKKAATKKAEAKPAPAKKAAAAKTATTKTAAAKTATTKTVTKKSPAPKSAAKKSDAGKSASKKSSGKKSSAKKK